jgi:hypothetical protein
MIAVITIVLWKAPKNQLIVVAYTFFFIDQYGIMIARARAPCRSIRT